MTIMKLGTRRSLLAWAQSSWVAHEIERMNPGLRVELVGIETRGDRILDVSLKTIEGKEFFVAELDQALRSEQVDLTVHSMKDLSLERPADFALAAIPRRENPRDVILFRPGILDRLQRNDSSQKPLKIGTSSPRRLEMIPSFLAKALPQFPNSATQPIKVDFVEIRGNVNTRLSRVHLPDEDPRSLDGVVLAFAGLIRLWANPAGRAELETLLQNVRWMILPLRECPTAPAQGALAVECRKEDLKTLRAIAPLHDPITATNVQAERAILAQWGGGCHQKLGATSIHSPALAEVGPLLFIRGKKPDETTIQEMIWLAPLQPSLKPNQTLQAWDGSAWRNALNGTVFELERLEPPPEIFATLKLKPSLVFVAHSRAVDPQWSSSLTSVRVWTSGTGSWFKLASQGIWVEGCAEGMGFEFLRETLQESVLQLPPEPEWTVFTHEQACPQWREKNQVIPTYRLKFHWGKMQEEGSQALNELRASTHVYWTSGSQFDEIKKHLPQLSHLCHACGPGKTADHLKKTGIHPLIFPSVEEWKKWLKLTH